MSNCSTSTRNCTRMRLTGDARLTVQVKVFPCRETPTAPVASSIVASGPPACPQAAVSLSVMEAELEPLLQKLRQSEMFAKQLCQNQKRAMDVNVPSYAPDTPLPRPPPESSCHVPVLGQWTSFFSRVARMAVNCDSSMVHHQDGDSINEDENSTIDTRGSWRYFGR